MIPRHRRSAVAALALGSVLLVGGCGADDIADSAAGSTGTGPSGTGATTASTAPSSSSGTTDEGRGSVPPPYIDHVAWAQTSVGPSLQVFPTRAGRIVDGEVLDEAWREVVALDPTADTPGMRAQFACHWTFARIVEPNKTSWNLEPNRPVVSETEMIAARCNPGEAEEQLPTT